MATATKRGASLIIALDYCLIRPSGNGERVIEGECMVEVEYDGAHWRSAAAHSAEGDWSEVIRFANGEAGDRADPIALLSRVTGKRLPAA